MEIIEIFEADPGICDGINVLMPQLSGSAPELTIDDLQKILGTEASTLIVAMEKGEILGCLMLSIFPVLTDIRGWIDDVVVSADERGRGIGRRLVGNAIKKAEALGAKSLNLTCNPNRKSAAALYQRLGFRQRKTRVYHRLL